MIEIIPNKCYNVSTGGSGQTVRLKNHMFNFFKSASGNKQLDAIIQRIEMNVSNNYKDAAQLNLKELEAEMKKLEDDGRLNPKQKEYYDGRLSSFRERMKNFTHKDQKPTWV